MWCPQVGLKPGLLNLAMSTLTMRSLHLLSIHLQCTCTERILALELSGMEQRWEIHTEKNNLLLTHGLLEDTKFIFQCLVNILAHSRTFLSLPNFLLFSTCAKCVNCNMLLLIEPSGIWRVRSGGVRYDKSRNTLSSYSITVLDRCQNLIYYPAVRTGRNKVKQILLLGKWK